MTASFHRRSVLAGLPGLALAACAQTDGAPPGAAPPPRPGVEGAPVNDTRPFSLSLATPLVQPAPLQSPLTLLWSAGRPGVASLYAIQASGTIIELFRNRRIQPGATVPFPARGEAVIRLGAPAGREEFVLLATETDQAWLSAADRADRSPFPRLALDRATFLQRLGAFTQGLNRASWEVASLAIETR